MVNSASYNATIAPDSLATIFGVGLAPTTASATLDSNGQLPTELASTRVEISGVPAPLVYVSPGQINLVVPGGLTAGTVTVLIRSTAAGSTKSGTALVGNSAPGIFTSDASGSGPGAILNGLTFSPAPFLVQTRLNGLDSRTRLAVYGTGLRHAGLVTATAQDSSGNRYPLNVEYAGAAPGFFGLDQINVLLVPDLDGAGAVSLSLVADDSPANLVTFQMDLMPASALRLATLTLSPVFIRAGATTTLTVGLSGVAHAGGFVVGLRSENAAAQVVPQITIPEGKASGQATVTTSAVTARSDLLITAQAGGTTQSVSLTIDPANAVYLDSLSTSVPSILGGKSLTGTVTLTGNSPGTTGVLLESQNPNVSVPSVVSVPPGKSSQDFTIATRPVSGAQPALLKATLGSDSATAVLRVVPPLQVLLDATVVVGGNPVNGSLTLGEPAPPTGASVLLGSSDPAVQVSPVAIPGGQSSQTFTLFTSAVNAAHNVSITATYAGFTQSASLTVNPPGAPTLSGLTITPNRVVGGNTTQGTVTLTAPAAMGGFRVDLQTSALRTASVPLFVIVPQGQSSAVFTITTTLSSSGVVTIGATAGGITKTATLTVQ